MCMHMCAGSRQSCYIDTISAETRVCFVKVIFKLLPTCRTVSVSLQSHYTTPSLPGCKWRSATSRSCAPHSLGVKSPSAWYVGSMVLSGGGMLGWSTGAVKFRGHCTCRTLGATRLAEIFIVVNMLSAKVIVTRKAWKFS